jgi:hypothetical protein
MRGSSLGVGVALRAGVADLSAAARGATETAVAARAELRRKPRRDVLITILLDIGVVKVRARIQGSGVFVVDGAGGMC